MSDADDFARIFNALVKNREDCLIFSQKLRTRFHHVLLLPNTSKPQPVRRGSYYIRCWSQIHALPSRRKSVPQSIRDEWNALASQGLRLRAEALEKWPDLDLQFVFPLNLIGRFVQEEN